MFRLRKINSLIKKSIIVLVVYFSVFTVIDSNALDFENNETRDAIQTPPSYHIISKTLLGTQRNITKYITNTWVKSSQYVLSKGESTSYSIQFSGATKEFESGVKLSGGFTISKTYSANVSITIPANSSKFSKLTYQSDYKKYNTHLQKTLWTGQNVDMGWSVVLEPTSDTYTIVVYQ